MIVRRAGPPASSWIAIGQADHARLAGELVGLLLLPELVESPRRREILRAVAEHDNGWWEEDAAPRLDPETGGPLDFRSLPGGLRRALWRRGIERRAAAEPYVAALVAGHALRLARTAGGRERPPAEEAAAFLDELEGRRRELLAAAGRSEEEAAADDRWLRLGDGLSLVALTLEPALLDLPGWRSEASATGAGADDAKASVELRVAPFPWAGATRFQVAARRLPVRGYRDAVELGAVWVAAPRETLEVRLAPAEPAVQPGVVANDSR